MFESAQSFKEISRAFFAGNGLLAYGKHPAGKKKKKREKNGGSKK